MQAVYYIGLDVHKKKIAYCIQTSAGKIVDQGMVASTRPLFRVLPACSQEKGYSHLSRSMLTPGRLYPRERRQSPFSISFISTI